MGTAGLNFTVTDVYGYTDTIKLIFTYTELGESGSMQLSPRQKRFPAFY